jgi:hypothetical protein
MFHDAKLLVGSVLWISTLSVNGTRLQQFQLRRSLMKPADNGIALRARQRQYVDGRPVLTGLVPVDRSDCAAPAWHMVEKGLTSFSRIRALYIVTSEGVDRR